MMMNKDNKVTEVINKLTIRAENERRNALLPDFIESLKIDAKITRARYESFLDANFTEAQALELCKAYK